MQCLLLPAHLFTVILSMLSLASPLCLCRLFFLSEMFSHVYLTPDSCYLYMQQWHLSKRLSNDYFMSRPFSFSSSWLNGQDMRWVSGSPASCISEFHLVSQGLHFPMLHLFLWKVSYWQTEQWTPVHSNASHHPSEICSGAKTLGLPFVSLDRNLGGDSKGWRERWGDVRF